MKRLILERLIHNPLATIGPMYDPDTAWSIFILENPDRATDTDDRVDAGLYICKRIISPKLSMSTAYDQPPLKGLKKGETFQLQNVPRRTHINFHWGSTEKDSLGCLITGLTQMGDSALGQSRLAFRKLMLYMAGEDQFQLEIRNMV